MNKRAQRTLKLLTPESLAPLRTTKKMLHTNTQNSSNHISTEIILGTRKCGPSQERVFIYFKLQEAIEAVIQLDLWKKDHSRIITE